jgi:tetratricopeptide (TPR) repeat protein
LLHGLIADVLLERAAKGDDSLGLEIAWHCMRCGRKEEATKHLLSGARVSISKGAVHEAERRLESGLSSLGGEDLKAARLLLVELLQEQGRWKESSQVLAAFTEERSTASGQCLAGQALICSHEALPSDVRHLAGIAHAFIGDSRLEPQTRLRALRLAGTIAQVTDSRSLAARLLEAANTSERLQWEDDENLEWDTQIVYLTHHTHERLEQSEVTIARLSELATRAQAHTIANARSSRILTGIGLCHRRAGRYSEAIGYYHVAIAILSRLERATSLSMVNGALASCHRDLADVEEQRKYALRAIPREAPKDFFQISAVFCAFEACHLLGDTRAAQEFSEQLDMTPLSSLHKQAGQVLLISRADAAWLDGRSRSALDLAKAAVMMSAASPLHRSNASVVARWLAVLRDRGEWEEGFGAIVDQVERLQAVCWWDEAERLRALVKLGQSGALAHSYEVELSAALERVPSSAIAFLARYGL